MPSKHDTQTPKQSFWARMDQRSRMFFVLALCCVMLLVSVAGAFFLVRGFGAGEQPAGSAASESTAQSESLVTDSGYDKEQNAIDTTQYTTTILEPSSDAGQDYVDETLFLGDSNTARMYRMFNYCSYDNAIGSVGMSAKSLASFACAKFSGYSGYKTMPEAVALMQPRRVVITFGTNDLNPNYTAASFVEGYKTGIQAVQNAYPSVDIIINSIPPLGKEHSNQSLTQSQVDEYNKAIVQMCQDNGWKYLNSAEVLKDGTTGYAKAGYVETSDGIHLTSTAMDVLFNYLRTHSYITEDDRPALTSIPTHTDDKDATVTSNVVATTVPQATDAPVAEPDPTDAPEDIIINDGSDSSSSSSSSASSQTYTYWTEKIEPTCLDQGYTIHHCNEDSAHDYTDNYIAALGHNPTTNADGSVTCSRCGTVLQQAAPAPTEAPTQAPESTPTPENPTEAPTEAPSDSSSGGIEVG